MLVVAGNLLAFSFVNHSTCFSVEHAVQVFIYTERNYSFIYASVCCNCFILLELTQRRGKEGGKQETDHHYSVLCGYIMCVLHSHLSGLVPLSH